MDDMDAIKLEGERSYYANRHTFNCPYARGTREFDAFERGWVQAQKRDPGPHHTLPPPPRDYTQASPPSPPERYNAYADIKGRGRP